LSEEGELKKRIQEEFVTAMIEGRFVNYQQILDEAKKEFQQPLITIGFMRVLSEAEIQLVDETVNQICEEYTRRVKKWFGTVESHG
jgi:hypothetical protein